MKTILKKEFSILEQQLITNIIFFFQIKKFILVKSKKKFINHCELVKILNLGLK